MNGSYAMSFLMCYLRLGVLGSPLLAPNCNDLLVDKIVKLLNQKKILHKNGPKQIWKRFRHQIKIASPNFSP